ncbi:Serine/arginine repetitive matrix protein 1 [Monascus purpureus]|uniref:Serine/arginine repetitive matrix protein 1 n=1 Tax=Monascus purpureus TaxID=5098 RepID=A0A507QR61_MONPU|nr:Serine/arginine repetitive matrix protein 1 [Monascus purpureus]
MTTSVDAKLLKQTKFPPEFSRKVDMTKVNIEVMKKWIAGKISEILGNEDDVVIELCFNLLEGSRFPDIKSLQIQLTGFLDKDTPKFCKELWGLCLSAQENAQGVPKELLEAKKLELIQEKVILIEAEKAAEEARRKKEQERARERELEEMRKRERFERNRGRWSGGGARGGRDYDRRYSRSPPRRRSRDYYQAVDRLGHHPARYPVLRHRHARHLVEHAGTVVGVRSAAPCRQTGVIIEGLREDVAVQTTVIDIDLLPAMIYRAHLLPDETDEDDDPFRRAVCRHRLYVEVAGGAATLLLQGQDLGRWLTPVQDPGRLMKGAANAEEIHPLMLARAGKTVMTVV